ncbi:hypothetical protein Tsubulata_019392 [Turnera subulata]|uniref:Uncharacterized protein n=1 Tax=Turnera subulata TaxID=218843 RepID=A0A9Q0F5Z6_9ROSI|nr:hypothetical protein Tsubulata_019392 [Turnera subulata]
MANPPSSNTRNVLRSLNEYRRAIMTPGKIALVIGLICFPTIASIGNFLVELRKEKALNSLLQEALELEMKERQRSLRMLDSSPKE